MQVKCCPLPTSLYLAEGTHPIHLYTIRKQNITLATRNPRFAVQSKLLRTEYSRHVQSFGRIIEHSSWGAFSASQFNHLRPSYILGQLVQNCHVLSTIQAHLDWLLLSTNSLKRLFLLLSLLLLRINKYNELHVITCCVAFHPDIYQALTLTHDLMCARPHHWHMTWYAPDSDTWCAPDPTSDTWRYASYSATDTSPNMYQTLTLTYDLICTRHWHMTCVPDSDPETGPGVYQTLTLILWPDLYQTLTLIHGVHLTIKLTS